MVSPRNCFVFGYLFSCYGPGSSRAARSTVDSSAIPSTPTSPAVFACHTDCYSSRISPSAPPALCATNAHPNPLAFLALPSFLLAPHTTVTMLHTPASPLLQWASIRPPPTSSPTRTCPVLLGHRSAIHSSRHSVTVVSRASVLVAHQRCSLLVYARTAAYRHTLPARPLRVRSRTGQL